MATTNRVIGAAQGLVRYKASHWSWWANGLTAKQDKDNFSLLPLPATGVDRLRKPKLSASCCCWWRAASATTKPQSGLSAYLRQLPSSLDRPFSLTALTYGLPPRLRHDALPTPDTSGCNEFDLAKRLPNLLGSLEARFRSISQTP